MKSDNHNRATAYVLAGRPLPAILVFAQRSFEKSPPPISSVGLSTVDVDAPLDLLKVVGVPDKLIDRLTSLTIHYTRRKTVCP